MTLPLVQLDDAKCVFCRVEFRPGESLRFDEVNGKRLGAHERCYRDAVRTGRKMVVTEDGLEPLKHDA